jgi:hypothetical protein
MSGLEYNITLSEEEEFVDWDLMDPEEVYRQYGYVPIRKNHDLFYLSMGIMFFVFINEILKDVPHYMFLVAYLINNGTIAFNNITSLFFIEQKKKEDEPADEPLQEPERKEEKYEDKYLDKFKNLEEVELSKEKLDGLKNSIIIERTPLGNVLMSYDNSRETFVYYSDNTIPYRFLEVVGRKYVVFNNCKSIFVDMEEELKKSELRLEEEKKKKEEEEKQKNEIIKGEPIRQDEKNVFAKLKKYNAPVKPEPIQSDKKTEKDTKKTEVKDHRVKEKSNRYSCEGRFANYTFLKGIDRKVIDKRLNMSFSEFKKKHLLSENKN